MRMVRTSLSYSRLLGWCQSQIYQAYIRRSRFEDWLGHVRSNASDTPGWATQDAQCQNSDVITAMQFLVSVDGPLEFHMMPDAEVHRHEIHAVAL